MPKNKTRRSSATPPDRLVKVARTATATATATKRTARTTTSSRIFMVPLARTVTSMSLTNTRNYPYTVVQNQYKTFIEDLNKILTNEKIIDREDKEHFKELLKEQRPYNKILYKLKSADIVCFVMLKANEESRIFNKYNYYKGNTYFNELLRKNNMSMLWLNYNTLYIHINI
jgi:hypothetical protein